MNKKYQVFISSTYEDLKEERLEVIKTILSLNCIPSGMEAFCSESEEQFEIIKRVIDTCDYYVLIVGNRYGSIHEKENKSYTELEYEYALTKDIPILVFIASKDADKPFDGNIDLLNAFKEKVSKGRMVSFWKNKDDLSKEVAIAFSNSFLKDNRVGWVRSDESDSLSIEVLELKKKNEENEASIQEMKNEISRYKKEIENITSFKGNLLYDQKPITITFNAFSKGFVTREITIKDIFRYVSVSFINVSMKEEGLLDLVAKAIDRTYYSYIDQSYLKRICNQMLALGLFQTYWSEDRKALFYELTTKGIKIRDELNLYVLDGGEDNK